MTIPANIPVPNPLDILIALSHGEELDHRGCSTKEAQKHFANKCKVIEDLKKRKQYDWMMKIYQRDKHNQYAEIRKSLVKRRLNKYKNNYQNKLMKQYFGEEENVDENDNPHSGTDWA